MGRTLFDLEDDTLLSDKKVFKDKEEHWYICYCYDGFAVAEKPVYDDGDCDPVGPSFLFLTYPKLDEVRKDKDLCHDILYYRVGEDAYRYRVSKGDVMMYLGEIETKSITREMAERLATHAKKIKIGKAREMSDKELLAMMKSVGVKAKISAE